MLAKMVMQLVGLCFARNLQSSTEKLSLRADLLEGDAINTSVFHRSYLAMSNRLSQIDPILSV